ncbi:Uncharacterised protein [uncultured archaeon]|nr:Uncharacterised protein [uncultured archaeon]
MDLLVKMVIFSAPEIRVYLSAISIMMFVWLVLSAGTGVWNGSGDWNAGPVMFVISVIFVKFKVSSATTPANCINIEIRLPILIRSYCSPWVFDAVGVAMLSVNKIITDTNIINLLG